MKTLRLLSLSLLAISAAHAAAYTVTVNTAGVPGGSQMDFQLNSVAGAPAVTATITGLNIAAVDLGLGTPSGTATGSFPGGVTLVNDPAQFNSYLQVVNAFPGSLTFQVALTGPGVDSPNAQNPFGSTFGFAILDQGFSLVLTPGTSLGVNVQIDIVGATTVIETNPGQVTADAVPEPATFAVAGMALAVLAALRSRRK